MSSSSEDMLEKCWELVIDQHFDVVRRANIEKGKGISIIRLLRGEVRTTEKGHEYNCIFNHALLDNPIIGHLRACMDDRNRSIFESDEARKDNVAIITLQFPEGEASSGEIRLFDLDTADRLQSEGLEIQNDR